jgi:hypothetical protein
LIYPTENCASLFDRRYHENTEDLVQAAYEGEVSDGFCGVQKIGGDNRANKVHR